MNASRRATWWLVVLLAACTARTPPPADSSEDTPADLGWADVAACDLEELGPRELSLDGRWSASVQTRLAGDDWGPATDLPEAAVPGWYFPFERFPTQDREVLLRYTRRVERPAAWACAVEAAGYRTVLEFDAADYEAVVRYAGREVGRHTGYLGRFGLVLPGAGAGDLEVELRDAVRDVDARGGMESDPRPTLQGADTGGWGVNPVGLPGSVRLRLVRAAYLRDAYAAAVRRGDERLLRVGLAWERLAPVGELTARVRLRDGAGTLLLEQDFVVEPNERGEARLETTLAAGSGSRLGFADGATVEVELRADGRLLDARTVLFVDRAVALEDGRLTVDGRPHFARGAAVHHLYRFLPFGSEAYAAGRYVALDAELTTRYAAALDEARGAGVEWLRAGHLVPDAVFLRLARERGLLVYQDFPLHWNTDWEALPGDELERQFREFLWRAAAEPAVALVAAYNEAELGETDADELATGRELLVRLLETAAETAPHLVAVGCSGCRGTAQFPPNAAYPVDEPLADAHSYFGSWWQPTDGYRTIPARVASLLSDDRPVLWSEMGNGWVKHYVYLAALTDVLEPDAPPELVALRGELAPWLRAPDGRTVPLAAFYAGLYCVIERGVAVGPELEPCAVEQRGAWSEAEAIAWAKSYFLADRPAVEGHPDDPVEAGVLTGAHWLAAQIFESRRLWALGEGLLGVLAWERPENGYPFSRGAGKWVPASVVERGRDIVAAANAPVAATLRAGTTGLEAWIVNDGPAATFTLRLTNGGVELWREERVVGAVASATIPSAATAPAAGRVVRLAVQRVGEEEAVAAAVVAPD
jgi:hypothetical protein